MSASDLGHGAALDGDDVELAAVLLGLVRQDLQS